MNETSSYLSVVPQVGERCFIHTTASVIGAVVLHDDVSVWPMSVLRGDVQRIEIGARSNIQDGVVVHVASDRLCGDGGMGVVLGEGVTVGHRAIIHACRIEAYSLVGMGAIVMDGAMCGDHVIIGAGAVVTPGQQLQSGSLWVGAPARFVRDLTTAEKKHVEDSAAHYVILKDEHIAHHLAD